MGAQDSESKRALRDTVLSGARYGAVMPAEAEARAAEEKLGPFASEPERPAFDSHKQSRERGDVVDLRPPSPPPQDEVEFKYDPIMIEPMLGSDSGYVPLCAALYWIMTRGGVQSVNGDDLESWSAGVEKLRPAICDGKVEAIGISGGQSLPSILKQGELFDRPNGRVSLKFWDVSCI